ncbi:MAG TPA: hypothetical protein DEQ20_02145 [Desulfobulbaceae bacterium]|nr:MAG: hypothetical protein A2520_03760 [Deltaproteobacteria bacterium RIFOXYD12_FULL_53_23]HCC53720.1 hypothetical protein [Desulfobulbaceae bacterium]
MTSSPTRFALKSKKSWLFAALLIFLFPCLGWGIETYSGDYKTILNSQTDTLTIWNYADNLQIYVLDFPNLTMQGRTFNRVTQFTEQAQNGESYPKVLNNDEFIRYMDARRRTQANFAFGHDVLVSEMVQFYNIVDRDKIDLFPEELELRDFLVDRRFIKVWRGFYQALQPDVVILSIPQIQAKKDNEPQVSELARQAIFAHEISHGEYYTNSHYANYCRMFWQQTLTDAQREIFLNFFKRYNYAVNIPELIVNEMQAYLMFTPDPLSFSAKKLGVKDEELESLREAFRKGKPPTKLPLR